MSAKIYIPGSDSLKPYQREITDLYKVFGIDPLSPSLTTDFTTFSMIVGSHFTNTLMDKKYQEFILLKLFLGFGCQVPEALYNQPLSELCKYLQINRTIQTVQEVVKPWLGINSIICGGDKISVNWICLMVENFIYRKGYTNLYDEPKFHAEVKEEEVQIFAGDKVVMTLSDLGEKTFTNLFEAYCFIVARVQNEPQLSQNLQ